MFSVTWKTGKGTTRVVVTDDLVSAQDIADMLIACQDIPSTILDMTSNMVSFQHNYKENERVYYKGEPYYVDHVIPGINVIYIRSSEISVTWLSIPVAAQDLSRQPV